MQTIAQIRQQYPDYHDLSDEQLAQALHQKFYADMPYEQFAQKVGVQATPVAATPAPRQLASGWANAAAPLETAATLASGMVAQPLAGLAGAATAAGNALGWSEQDPAETVRSTQEALTYQPRTKGGELLNQVVGYPFEKFAQGADWAGGKTAELTGSPALGAAVNTAIQGAPYLLGAKKLAGEWTAPRGMTPEVAAASDAGLSLTPQQARAPLGNLAQGLAGSAKLERAVSRKNAPLVNALAAEDIGLPRGTVLTEANLSAAEAPAASTYNQVAQIGAVPVDAQFHARINALQGPGAGSFPSATPKAIEALKADYSNLQGFHSQDAIDHIQQLRYESRYNLGPDRSPNEKALGRAQLEVATALEDQIDRFLSSGQTIAAPDLLSRFREARTLFAKIYNVRNAMKGTNVVAGKLAKAQDAGAPLTGNLKTIADAAQNFDRSFQDVTKIRDDMPLSVVDALSMATLNKAFEAVTLARPVTRGVLASDTYQNMGVRGQFPKTGGILPALVLQSSQNVKLEDLP